jgi:hypothetical protein
VKFEIVSEITQIETIAAGNSIRVLSSLTKRYGRRRWRKKKELQRLNFRTEVFAPPKFIGMKRTESEGAM